MLRKYLNEYYGLSVKLIETVKRGTRTFSFDENISIDSADYEEDDDDDDDDSCCDLRNVAKGLRISVMK
eukprot:scaffold22065_cov21-Cyclotella_meneghiniana.AAC.1